jgi:hypothetical protein
MRARERHAAVHALLTEGVGIKEICRRLGLARGTVRRFARADTVEELLTRNGTGRRPSLLDEFKPYLHQRWNAGSTNAATLLTEITAHGYQGGPTLLRHYLHQFRTTARIPRPPRKPPSVRRVVGWIMTNPTTMNPADQQRLDAILATSPHLNTLAGHIRTFATMMCSLRGQDLESWMTAVDTDDQPALRSFVVGLRRDQDAVTAGLTLPTTAAPSKATSTDSKCCRVAGGVAAPGSHRTVRNDLPLYGSCCPGHQTAGTVGTQAQWAKNWGLMVTALFHASCAFLRPRSRLCFLRSQRIK